MRELKPVIFLFSVYNKESITQNAWKHEMTVKALRTLDVPYKEMQGVYDGKREESIMVVGGGWRNLVESVCKKFGQESYLVSYGDRSSYLHRFDSDKNEYLGTLREFNEQPEGDYTLDLATGRYWKCV